MSELSGTKSNGERQESFSVTVEDARLKRDEGESGLTALLWVLRRVDSAADGERVIRYKQVLEPQQLEEIMKNLALCGIVTTFAELPAHLVKAAGCELEVRRGEGEYIEFVRRLDTNVFAGVVEGQNVAGEIPL